MNLSTVSLFLAGVFGFACVACSLITWHPRLENHPSISIDCTAAASVLFLSLAALFGLTLRGHRQYDRGWPVRLYAGLAAVAGLGTLALVG